MTATDWFKNFIPVLICLLAYAKKVHMYDRGSTIDVSDFLQGDGDPWILTQTDLENAVSNISKTRKTVFFPAGVYYSSKLTGFRSCIPKYR